MTFTLAKKDYRSLMVTVARQYLGLALLKVSEMKDLRVLIPFVPLLILIAVLCSVGLIIVELVLELMVVVIRTVVSCVVIVLRIVLLLIVVRLLVLIVHDFIIL